MAFVWCGDTGEDNHWSTLCAGSLLLQSTILLPEQTCCAQKKSLGSED
jgi:hypothetical protein